MNKTLSRLEAVKLLRECFKCGYGVLELNDEEYLTINKDGKIFLTIDSEDYDWASKEITWKQCLKEISFRYERYPLVYVNAYEVRQSYGGAEEGGWWYDYGVPLASVPVRKRGNSTDAVVNNLTDMFAKDYEDRRSRTSAAGDGADLQIVISSSLAVEYPEAVPHYE